MPLIIRKGDTVYYPKYMVTRNQSVSKEETLHIHPTHIFLALKESNGLEYKLATESVMEVECLPRHLGRMGLLLLPKMGLVSLYVDIDSGDRKNLLTSEVHMENTFLQENSVRIYGDDITIDQVAQVCLQDGLGPREVFTKTLYHLGWPEVEIVESKMSDLMAHFNKEEKNEN